MAQINDGQNLLSNITKDINKANAAAFEGIDIATFQADLITFWNSGNKRSAARRNRIFKSYGMK